MDELCCMCHSELYYPNAIRLDYKDRLGKCEIMEYIVCEKCLQKVSSYIENYGKPLARLVDVPAEDPEDPFET